jgi:mRNA interferase RelE/StbE
MGKYRIAVKKSAVKELNKIPDRDLKKIVSRIESLADNPRPKGCEKLSQLERYRVKQGNYRILYSIEDDALTVCVVKIGHRKDIYRNRP